MRRNFACVVTSISAAALIRSCSSGTLRSNLMSFRHSPLNTLIVSTTLDTASVNIADALKSSCDKWTIHSTSPQSSVYYTKASSSLIRSEGNEDRLVWLWVQNQPLLHLNHVHQLLNNELLSTTTADSKIDEIIAFDEVIFLSKHCAASGKASLTVHPIGIPWMTDATEAGGIPGKCSPPNKRIAELYRAVLAETKIRGMQDLFEITLEATHHGPYVELPTCFVEIGSTEAEWSIPEAGIVWADCILKHFCIPSNIVAGSAVEVEGAVGDGGVDVGIVGVEKISKMTISSGSSSNSGSDGVVLVTIGGGHYVPKMNDAARYGAGMYTGHSLATYTLQRHLDGTHRDPVPGGWKHIVEEALTSTRIAHPTRELIVLLDKKAFIAEYKNDIIKYLEELNINWTHKTADVKLLWEKTMKTAKEVISV